jgi:hypothetical protein
MTLTQTADDTDSFARFRARNKLIRLVRDRLRGRGLDIRELENELVISSPGHPERGRVYVTYVSGEVSHRRTIWDYLGHLDGCCSGDRETADSGVRMETIAGLLTSGEGDSL